jgi:hypothetical protein
LRAFSLACEACKGLLTVNCLYAAALHIIIATVKHAAGFRHFGKLSSHRVFNQIGGGPAGLGSQFVQA